MPFSPLITSMMDAALKAAHIALLRRREGLKIAVKPDSTRVTNGDSQSEQIIRHAIETDIINRRDKLGLDAKEPIGFIMEETAQELSKRSSGYQFVVDPIDGTRGYSRLNPGAPWAISIALERRGVTIAAVVYEAAYAEFGVDAAGNDMPFNPSRPSGTLFIVDETGAWRLNPPEDGFIAEADHNTNYTQNEINHLWLLASIPFLHVDFSKGITTPLTKQTPLTPGAGLQLDQIRTDWLSAPGANEAALMLFRRVCEPLVPVTPCLSAVTGGVKAADGRAAGFIYGNGFPWDHSAIRLILAQSGTPIIEYALIGYEQERSVLIAGRHAHLFTTLIKTAQGLSDLTGDIIMQANIPE